ncbi:MAG: hypothetical protein AAB686_03825 [Patescibacteria group bacterium]
MRIIRIILVVSALILLPFFYWLGGLGGVLVGTILTAAIVLRFLAFMGSLALGAARTLVNLTIAMGIVALLLWTIPGGGLGQAISARFTSWATGDSVGQQPSYTTITLTDTEWLEFHLPPLGESFFYAEAGKTAHLRVNGELFVVHPDGRITKADDTSNRRLDSTPEPNGGTVYLRGISPGRTRMKVTFRAKS